MLLVVGAGVFPGVPKKEGTDVAAPGLPKGNTWKIGPAGGGGGLGPNVGVALLPAGLGVLPIGVELPPGLTVGFWRTEPLPLDFDTVLFEMG